MPKKKLFNFIHSLSFKISLILLLFIIILFTLNSMLLWRRQLAVLEGNIKLWAFQTSNLVKEGLYRMMLFNERDELYQTILILGKESHVERVRIYNKHGEIKFSNREDEIAQLADFEDNACRSCHSSKEPPKIAPSSEYFYIFNNLQNERILGLINPIMNNPDCSSAGCHFHQAGQKVLGVLNIQMSLSKLDQTIFESRKKTYICSIIFILLSLFFIALVIYLIIHVPFKKLRLGTEALAQGSLNHRIELVRKDELGLLARSFNSMAENLQTAYQRLQDWSSELEARVQKKTDELERMHHSMLHVEKMASLGTMAATVAHEINNPLTGIVTYAKLLQKKIKRLLPEETNGEIVKELELIRTESMRCGNIVRDLLLFARESSAKFHKYKLNSIISAALKILKHHLELSDITYTVTNPFDSKKIVCDSEQLNQALIALLVNAAEAMPNGGNLDISVRPVPDHSDRILLIIRDSGTGITEDIRDKIFDPFYSTKKKGKGVGLGLAVVYGIIQRHQGRIWFESEVNRGTTFFIELPVDPTNQKEQL